MQALHDILNTLSALSSNDASPNLYVLAGLGIALSIGAWLISAAQARKGLPQKSKKKSAMPQTDLASHEVRRKSIQKNNSQSRQNPSQ